MVASPPGGGFGICKTAHRARLRILSIALEKERRSWTMLCCAVLSRSVVSDSVTPRTVAHQVLLSMGILQARIQEWVFSTPGDLSDPRIELGLLCLLYQQVDSLPLVLPNR